MESFKPKRLRAYKIPENYRDVVNLQIRELLRLGFLGPSTSPQVSPLVCVLKPKDVNGKRAVRTCVDYRFVNKYTLRYVPLLDDINGVVQKIGNARYSLYRNSMQSQVIINAWSRKKIGGLQHSYVMMEYFNTVELHLV